MAKKEEEVVKVIAPTKKDGGTEVLEDVPVQSTPEVNVVQVNQEQGESKGKKVFGEIKAFFILLILIGIIGGGTWYWYTHIYDPGKTPSIKDPDAPEEKSNNVYAYEAKGKELLVVGDYLLEGNAGYINKIMNLKTEVLYEGKVEYNYVFVGVDNKLYLVLDESGDYNENTITLYRLEDDKLNELDPIGSKGVFYSPFVLAGDEDKLIGFVGVRLTQNDEGDEEQTEYVKLLDGTTYERKVKDTIHGRDVRLGMGDFIYTTDEKYVVTRYIVDAEAGSYKYGLYDYVDNKMVMDASYDTLKEAAPGFYIAVKENKAGIIDYNRKIIVDYKYDYIEYFGDFYVVALNNKLAIMDKKFNFVTGFDYDVYSGFENEPVKYYYYPCCTSSNTYDAFSVGDKYVLVTNYREGFFNFPKHEAFIISSDGSSEKFEELSVSYNDSKDLIYSSTKKNVFDVYDKNMKKKYTIDLTKYDYEVSGLELVNGNTIRTDNYNVTPVYIDYETGEEIKGLKDFEQKLGNVTLVYKAGKLTINVNDKEDSSFSIADFNYADFKETTDGSYYLSYNSGSPVYVFIEKGE
jgi:hypothetical protein